MERSRRSSAFGRGRGICAVKLAATALLSVGMLLVVGGASGCRQANQDAVEHSTSPYERARSVVQQSEGGQSRAAKLSLLVAYLEDDDPGVRLVAIEGLRRLVGETLGYEYFAPEAERADAVARWQAALASGRFSDGTVVSRDQARLERNSDTSGGVAATRPVDAGE